MKPSAALRQIDVQNLPRPQMAKTKSGCLGEQVLCRQLQVPHPPLRSGYAEPDPALLNWRGRRVRLPVRLAGGAPVRVGWQPRAHSLVEPGDIGIAVFRTCARARGQFSGRWCPLGLSDQKGLFRPTVVAFRSQDNPLFETSEAPAPALWYTTRLSS